MARHPFVLLVLLFLAGCLEFDAQEVVVHHDAAQDRIDILFVYRGLYAESSDGTPKALEKALADLTKAREMGHFAFWNNWPFKVDPCADTKTPVATALLAHVDVETGGLYTDPQGTLCAYQFVRIRDASSFVAKLEQALQLALQAAMLSGMRGADGVQHTFDQDTRVQLRDFLRDGDKLLAVAPGRIELRLPCSAADHRWLRRQLEEHFLDNAPREIVRRHAVAERRAKTGENADTFVDPGAVDLPGAQLEPGMRASASFRFFWDNDLSFAHEDGITTLALGTGEGPTIAVHKASDGLYHDELLKELRRIGDAIEDGVPEQEIERRFALFHARDAKLVPKLAEKRAGGAKADEAAKDK